MPLSEFMTLALGLVYLRPGFFFVAAAGAGLAVSTVSHALAPDEGYFLATWSIFETSLLMCCLAPLFQFADLRFRREPVTLVAGFVALGVFWARMLYVGFMLGLAKFPYEVAAALFPIPDGQHPYLVGIAFVGLFLTPVSVYITVRIALAPAAVMEGFRPELAVLRSWALVKGRVARTLALLLVSEAFLLVLEIIAEALAGDYAELVVPFTSVAMAIALPLQVSVVFLLLKEYHSLDPGDDPSTLKPGSK